MVEAQVLVFKAKNGDEVEFRASPDKVWPYQLARWAKPGTDDETARWFEIFPPDDRFSAIKEYERLRAEEIQRG